MPRFGPGRFYGKSGMAVVLGSGLSALCELVETVAEIPYGEVPGLTPPSAEGHPGRLSLCRLAGFPLLLFAGRRHFYEDGEMEIAGSVAGTAAGLGCRRILLTQAAGSLHRELKPGSWVLPRDIISRIQF